MDGQPILSDFMKFDGLVQPPVFFGGNFLNRIDIIRDLSGRKTANCF